MLKYELKSRQDTTYLITYHRIFISDNMYIIHILDESVIKPGANIF